MTSNTNGCTSGGVPIRDFSKAGFENHRPVGSRETRTPAQQRYSPDRGIPPQNSSDLMSSVVAGLIQGILAQPTSSTEKEQLPTQSKTNTETASSSFTPEEQKYQIALFNEDCDTVRRYLPQCLAVINKMGKTSVAENLLDKMDRCRDNTQRK